jgi:hypothetical protein
MNSTVETYEVTIRKVKGEGGSASKNEVAEAVLEYIEFAKIEVENEAGDISMWEVTDVKWL